MDKSKLYYISHPYTSYGDLIENQEKAREIERILHELFGIQVINPILLPLGNDNETAMSKCRHLYNACDAIIFCPGWDKSRGCAEEFKWARQDRKPMFLFNDRQVKPLEVA